MAVRVTLSLAQFERQLHRAFKATVRDVERALPAAHDRQVYGWNQQTRRRNGETVGSPRDVRDTGALARSQQPAQYSDPTTARITWTADHAAAVYLGAVFRKRELSLPARNVPRDTLQAMNLPALFVQHFQELS